MSYLTATVRVNDRIKSYGGAFVDTTQPEGYPRSIGGEPVEVVLTPQISQWLSSGHLILDISQPQSPKVVWPQGLRRDVIDLLESHGLTPEKVARSTDEELTALEGIGPGRLRNIREYIPEE